MHYKVLLFLTIVIVGAFFYLHKVNPAEISFVLNKDYSYTLPITYLIIGGFFVGVVLSVMNSLVVDLRRAVKDMKARRERKRREVSEANYRAGISAFYRGKHSKALQFFSRVLSFNPADIDIYIRLAEAHEAEGDIEEGIKVLEKGLLKIPDSIELLLQVAAYADTAGDIKKTEQKLGEILKLDSENSYALGRLRDFKVYSNAWGEAVGLQRKIVASLKSGEAGELAREKSLLVGFLYEEAVEKASADSFDEASAAIKEILKSEEGFIPAHILLGEIYRKREDPQSALRVWTRAFDIHHDPVLLLKIEEAYLEQSAPDKLLDLLRNATLERPQDMDLALLLARLYLRLEMIDEAIGELERLKSGVEASYYLEMLLGEAYMRRGMTEEAALTFHGALGLDRALPPSFVCSECAHGEPGWRSRCPDCRQWNSLKMSRTRVASRDAVPENFSNVKIIQ